MLKFRIFFDILKCCAVPMMYIDSLNPMWRISGMIQIVRKLRYISKVRQTNKLRYIGFMGTP